MTRNKYIKLIKEKLSETRVIAKSGFRLHKIAYKYSKLNYLAMLVIGTLIALLPFLNNWLGGKVIDALIQSIEQDYGLSRSLIIVVVSYIVLLAIMGFLRNIYNYFSNMQVFDMQKRFTLIMQRALKNLDIEHHEDPTLKDTLDKARDSYTYRPINFLQRSFYFINDITSIVASLLVLVVFSPIIIVIVVLGTIPSFLNNIFFGRKKYGIFDADSEVRRNFWRSSYYLQQPEALAEIKIYRAGNFLIKHIENLYNSFQDRQKSLEQKRNIYMILLGIIYTITFGIAYWLVIVMVVNQQITIGSFTFYIATIRTFQNTFSSLMTTYSALYENGLYLVDIFKIIDTKPIIKTGGNRLTNKIPPKISFNDVSFKYPNSEEMIFKNLNFSIESGENIAIVGGKRCRQEHFCKTSF